MNFIKYIFPGILLILSLGGFSSSQRFYEYKILKWPHYGGLYLNIEKEINIHAKQGWRVVGINNGIIVLEREK